MLPGMTRTTTSNVQHLHLETLATTRPSAAAALVARAVDNMLRRLAEHSERRGEAIAWPSLLVYGITSSTPGTMELRCEGLLVSRGHEEHQALLAASEPPWGVQLREERARADAAEQRAAGLATNLERQRAAMAEARGELQAAISRSELPVPLGRALVAVLAGEVETVAQAMAQDAQEPVGEAWRG